MIDAAVAGMAIIPLSANYTLTSTLYASNEARNAILKLTGSAPWTVTIPSASKAYLVWNASSAVQTLTTGAGTAVSIDPTDIVLVFCDGTNVNTLGFAGMGLKQFIAASVLAATGSLPAVTGNAGKAVYTDGASSFWKLLAAADISDFNSAVNSRALSFALALTGT
jgi:hypothetical protein